MGNRRITLREMKAMLPRTAGKKLPTPRRLRENEELLDRAVLADCAMEVYSNGFAVYSTPCHYAVIRMENVGVALYESGQDGWRSSVDLGDEDWAIGVMLCGEERMEKRQGERAEGRLVPLAGDGAGGDAPGMGIDAGVDVLAEVAGMDETERLLGCLTGRQREAVTLHYFHGLTQEEIAGRLRVSHQAVGRHLKAALKKMKKNF